MYLPLFLLVCLLFDVQVIRALPVEGTLSYSPTSMFVYCHTDILKQPCFLLSSNSRMPHNHPNYFFFSLSRT